MSTNKINKIDVDNSIAKTDEINTLEQSINQKVKEIEDLISTNQTTINLKVEEIKTLINDYKTSNNAAINNINTSITNLNNKFNYNGGNLRIYHSAGGIENPKVIIKVPTQSYCPYTGFIFLRYSEPIPFNIVTDSNGKVYIINITTGTGLQSVTQIDDNTIEIQISSTWSLFSMLYFTQYEQELIIQRS